jgi:hypothetical protein
MISRLSLAVLTALITGALWAAPPLTTIRDTIYKADGTRFAGQVIIEWRSFEAADRSFIGRQRLQVSIVDGFLNVRLVPTTNAANPAYYMVRYISGSGTEFTEAWAVRPSQEALRVRDVRIADPLLGPGAGTGGNAAGDLAIGDVDGLQAELDIRPRRGASYQPGAAAVIGATGELEAAAGNPQDCVRVDGSSGPCGGTASAVFGTFVDGETPGGAVNGSNMVFTLSQAPNPPTSLLLYRNGMLQKRGLDYELSGQTVTFVAGATPQPGDVLIASYRTAGSGGTLPQVLCTGPGGSTSGTAATSLGTCSIPAGLLRAGDRLEVQFDYAHQGATTGFTVDVRWGATALAGRTATASTSMLTGRATAAVYSAGTLVSAQTWGAGLAVASEAREAGDNTSAGLTIDFRGNMATATMDVLVLRNYTVIRYPAP